MIRAGTIKTLEESGAPLSFFVFRLWRWAFDITEQKALQ
jgi:hypothetical protein